MDDNHCFRCGVTLTPIAEIGLSDLMDMNMYYRERFPHTWQDRSEDKVRVCDPCDEELNLIETPEQYEIRKIIEG